MAQTSFRAGSGSYQFIIPLTLTLSSIPGFSTSVETFTVAGGNITQGALSGVDKDSVTTAEFAAPTGANVTGLVLENSYITVAANSNVATLTLVIYNETSSTISPGSQQVNLLVF